MELRTITCLTCGIEITRRFKKTRKWCSKDCYVSRGINLERKSLNKEYMRQHFADYRKKKRQDPEWYASAKAQAKEWASRNPERRRRDRRRSWWRASGIDVDAAEMLMATATRCFLCGSEDKLYLDHDHKTFRIRGALCIKCNTALGSFNDDPDLMEKAIGYVKG